MEDVSGGNNTSSKINMSVEYADGVDELCRTLWLLDSCKQHTEEPITDTFVQALVTQRQ